MEKGGSGKLSASFIWLNITQFLGALNDNIFKLFAMFFIIGLRGRDDAARVMGIGGVAFVLPFLLFTAAAGALADRHSKRTIIVIAKALEIGVMALGAAAFALESEWALYGVVFLMSAQSALFGPAKYSIVPEIVGREQLSRANSALVMFTYLAIIAGSFLAPLVVQAVRQHYLVAQGACLAIAIAGWGAARRIEPTQAVGAGSAVSVRFIRDIWRTLRSIRGDGYLMLAVMASAYFTLLGAFMQLNIIPYGMQHLGLSQENSAYLFFLAAVGIALGAMAAGRMSGRNIELGIVPIGALVLTLAVMALRNMRSLGSVLPAIFLAGLGAGMFIVPLDAFIQFRAPASRRGEVLAASAFLSWVGVLMASGAVYLMGWMKVDAGAGFLALGVLTLALAVAAFKVLPDFLVRFLGVVITRLVYRIRVLGGENVPIEGGALLVCNHVSWVDALLLLATQQRRIRFVMERSIYDTPVLRPLFRLMGAIPISTSDSPKKVIMSLREARKALDDGYLVCIFAEGAITRSGMMRGFRAGFEHIVKDSAHPIVPAYIGGAWGSIFSFYYGRPLSHWPTMLRYPVTVLFGRPLPAMAGADVVREAVMELSCNYYNDKKPTRLSLGAAFVAAARQNWNRRAVADTTGRDLTFGRALVGATALADKLRGMLLGEEMVGLLLPPSASGVLANAAVTLLGKISVNLNYTASDAAFRAAVEQCGLRHILSSRAFLEKLGRYQDLEGVIFLEDVLKQISDAEKRHAWWKARFLPYRAWARPEGFTADTVATVIFSSGSTGTPKGVMLSHHNVLSNVESVRAVFHFSAEDCICAALPFFHSFGFTCSLWLPLLSGFAAVYHSNPLDGARIAEVVREHRATLLFATPTFLLAYLRRAQPEDFATLRYVITGAEKLKARIADAFEERFGVRPLEGYGATELAPVATLNIPDVEIWGVHQVGRKPGTVGHPLPGVTAKVVDPETGERMPVGKPGLLFIKGPNVMLGYLKNPEKTAEVLRDGWYNTGDIAVMDKDGFLTITDRLSRFSKIGGEMVPHGGVEEVYHRALGKTSQVLVVASVPDEKKGERLVVLYTDEAGDAAKLHEVIRQADIPNLWKPAADAYCHIESIPVLGSGKLDLKTIKERAMQWAGSSTN